MNAEYTLEYFNSQVCEFRKLFGQKDFWAKPEAHRDLAVKALTFVYLNVKTKNADETEQLKSVFKNTMDEYDRRGTMIFMLAIGRLSVNKGLTDCRSIIG